MGNHLFRHVENECTDKTSIWSSSVYDSSSHSAPIFILVEESACGLPSRTSPTPSISRSWQHRGIGSARDTIAHPDERELVTKTKTSRRQAPEDAGDVSTGSIDTSTNRRHRASATEAQNRTASSMISRSVSIASMRMRQRRRTKNRRAFGSDVDYASGKVIGSR